MNANSDLENDTNQAEDELSDRRNARLVAIVVQWIASVFGLAKPKYAEFVRALTENSEFTNRLAAQSLYYQKCANKLLQSRRDHQLAKAGGGIYRPTRAELRTWFNEQSADFVAMAQLLDANARFHNQWERVMNGHALKRWLFNSPEGVNFRIGLLLLGAFALGLLFGNPIMLEEIGLWAAGAPILGGLVRFSDWENHRWRDELGEPCLDCGHDKRPLNQWTMRCKLCNEIRTCGVFEQMVSRNLQLCDAPCQFNRLRAEAFTDMHCIVEHMSHPYLKGVGHVVWQAAFSRYADWLLRSHDFEDLLESYLSQDHTDDMCEFDWEQCPGIAEEFVMAGDVCEYQYLSRLLYDRCSHIPTHRIATPLLRRAVRIGNEDPSIVVPPGILNDCPTPACFRDALYVVLFLPLEQAIEALCRERADEPDSGESE